MADIPHRWPQNPIIRCEDIAPTADDLEVACVLNPGAFEYNGRTGLLLRVAERPKATEGFITTCVRDRNCPDGLRRIQYRRDDPHLACSDPRALSYKGQPLLTTISHLRLAWSDDGIAFRVDPAPTLAGEGPLETYGIEDCRVVAMNGEYLLTYTAVSPAGVAVACCRTRNWQDFQRDGLLLPPHNKDCAIFPRRIDDAYWALHRPSGQGLGGHFIWSARSPDLRHWGDHRCLAMTRAGRWDSNRIGANAAPIETPAGWLLLYHGADDNSRYGLGAMLLDRDRPWRVLGRTPDPILSPATDYETNGFFGQVVFSNGHRVRGAEIDIYYGAADKVICGATAKIDDILTAIEPLPANCDAVQ